MDPFLALSRAIDALNGRVGRAVGWLVLLTTLISAGNAVSRYGFNVSSNAWLEVQWYLFSAIFLLGSGYALLTNAHVRIDLVAVRLRRRTNAWIDVVGIVVFLIPTCLVFLKFGWDMFYDSYARGEISADSGGLVRWPVKVLVPVGFLLLLLQALSELVKRIAYLRGKVPWDGLGNTPDEPPPDARVE